MRNILIFATAMIQAAVIAEQVVLVAPPSSMKGTPVGVVWIVGESYQSSQYVQVAQEFQLQAAKQGLAAWIGIPSFTFSTPNPKEIGGHIQTAMDFMQAGGFEGDAWFLAAHSLGGVMTQQYLGNSKSKPDPSLFKGQVLMSSVLLRGTRSIQDDGSTKVDFETPTLTIGGTKDGLMRITRIAEAYWHQAVNIQDSQADIFPVSVLEGVSHAQFASGEPPKFVRENDLRADVSEDDAHKEIGASMAQFVSDTLKSGKSSTGKETHNQMNPFVEAMVQEGYYELKPACYTSTMVNPDDPKCWTGSPWVQNEVIPAMIGELSSPQISIKNDDNFHRAATVYPYHHPELQGQCPQTVGEPCEIFHFSVTENVYNKLNELDTGKTAVSAYEMRAKLKSSQSMHVAAGEADADFDALDKTKQECQRVNQHAWDWAYARASKAAIANYEADGQKVKIVEDRIDTNGGTWIYKPLKEKENKDKTEREISSLAMPLPHTEPLALFRDMHYCKLLSPFRALELIYVDSLYAHGGYQSTAGSNPELFLQ